MKSNSQNLYRHFDKDGELLYIGISISALLRLSQHKNESHWFDHIVRVDIERFDSRISVLGAEKEAIKNEKPKYNSKHNLYHPKPFNVKNIIKLDLNIYGNDKTKKLIHYMEILNFSKHEVSKAAGVNIRTVERWLSGERSVSNPVLKLMELSCMIYNFQTEVYLFLKNGK